METQIHKDEEMETVEKESVKRRRQNVYKGDAREIAVTKKIKEKRIKEGKMERRKRERGKRKKCRKPNINQERGDKEESAGCSNRLGIKSIRRGNVQFKVKVMIIAFFHSFCGDGRGSTF